ncbi:MAG TPA: tetratricopeptide repeat protein [Actinocrinis sp.]|uniref:ATP-binding protein n=1 Tax=Actinocrinis sp. TaxID=1920516 RepID=UPI002DDDBD19|nr:tetratricopeptide repeat protein [Actinocrinis sp.]HEV2344912.1 tetratricopeptide repeat protein [Actinocrinis sp.]
MEASAPFGALLREYRLGSGLTQEELAARASLSVRAINYLETGSVRRPQQRTVDALAEALRLTGDQAGRLHAAARPSTGGAPVPVPAAPCELPPQSVPFVGRGGELAAALRAVGRGAGGVIAVCGMPGVGKTSFAVRLAHRLAVRYPDGQLFMDLRGLDDRPMPLGHALTRLLGSLGVPAPESADVEEQTARYRSAVVGRRMIVVLDNARDEGQVRPLLPGGEGSLIIVTSRRLLAGLDCRLQLTLDVLDIEQTVQLLRRFAGPAEHGPARRTATQRSGGALEVDQRGVDQHGVDQRSDGQHGDNRHDPAAGRLRELARLSGGLPLAVRALGARLATRPQWPHSVLVRQLADEQRRLDRLAVGDLEVRAAFELSLRALPAGAKQLFLGSGVAPGAEIAAAAAAALLDAPAAEACRLLDALADFHLVEPTADPDRYRRHDLIRLYAAELVRADPQHDVLVERLARWYLAAATAATRVAVPGPTMLPAPHGLPAPHVAFETTAQAARWLDEELPNLVHIAQAAARAECHALSWQLADALRWFCYQRRALPYWLALAQSGLACARRAGDRRAQAAMLNSLGLVRDCQGADHAAAARYSAAVRISAQDGWLVGQAAAVGNLGRIHFRHGELDAARACYSKSLDLNRAAGNRHGEAIRLGNLAGILRARGELVAAQEHYTAALAAYRASGDRRGEALTLVNLGNVRHAQQRFAEAAECNEQALRIATETASGVNEALAYRGLAAAHRHLGPPGRALELSRRAIELACALGDGMIEVDSLTVAAGIERDRGDFAAAALHDLAALRRAWRTGYRHGQVDAIAGLAVTRRRQGHASAGALARRAAWIARESRYQVTESDVAQALAGVLSAPGRS